MTSKNTITKDFMLLDTENGPEIVKINDDLDDINNIIILTKINLSENINVKQIISSDIHSSHLWGIDDNGDLFYTSKTAPFIISYINLKYPVIDMAYCKYGVVAVVYDVGTVTIVNPETKEVIDIDGLVNINNVYESEVEPQNKMIINHSFCAVSKNILYNVSFTPSNNKLDIYPHIANDDIVYIGETWYRNRGFKWYLTILGDIFIYKYKNSNKEIKRDFGTYVISDAISLNFANGSLYFMSNNNTLQSLENFIYDETIITVRDFNNFNIKIVYTFTSGHYQFFIDTNYKIYVSEYYGEDSREYDYNNYIIKEINDPYGNQAILYHENIKKYIKSAMFLN